MKSKNMLAVIASMAGMAQKVIPRMYSLGSFRGIQRGACKSSVKQTSRSKYMPHQGQREKDRRK